MITWSLFLLAFAVSIDGLTVGITYGMRNVHVPLRSLLIISFFSCMTFLVAMGIGRMLYMFFFANRCQRNGWGDINHIRIMDAHSIYA